MKFLDWLLNKASPNYAQRISGGDSYWSAALEGDKRLYRTTAQPVDKPAFDPVYGLGAHEVGEWLDRNPQLRPTYQAQAQQ